MEMEKKVKILDSINKELDSLIFDNNSIEIVKNINYSNKLSLKVLDLVLFGFEDTYLNMKGDYNYNTEINKKMNTDEWFSFKESMESEYTKIDEDSIKLIKYKLSNSDKRKSSCLEILILINLIIEYMDIKSNMRAYLKDTTHQSYKLYNNMERVSEDKEELIREPKESITTKIYKDNLNWNGSNWERRINVNLNKLSTSILATFIINRNSNRSNKYITKDINAKIKSFNNNNTKVILKSENTYFAYASMLKVFSKTNKDTLFKWNLQDNACPICRKYSHKNYKYNELIPLPVHPNGRCFYTIIL